MHNYFVVVHTYMCVLRSISTLVPIFKYNLISTSCLLCRTNYQRQTNIDDVKTSFCSADETRYRYWHIGIEIYNCPQSIPTPNAELFTFIFLRNSLTSNYCFYGFAMISHDRVHAIYVHYHQLWLNRMICYIIISVDFF